MSSILTIPALILVTPLIATLIDMVQKNTRPTLRNLLVGYALYAGKIYLLLLAQLIYIPIMFALFPAGFFLQFLSLVDMIVRWFNLAPTDPTPLLCNWGGVAASACTPALLAFHIGHPLLAVIALKYGDRLLDRWGNWMDRSLEAMTGWIEK